MAASRHTYIHIYTRVLQCSHTSVGLAQAHPNNTTTGAANMYMWNEAIASRGTDEICSCLKHHLEILSVQTKKLTCFSDSCFGQNKNFQMICFWNQQVLERFEQVDHKFLVILTCLMTGTLHILKNVRRVLESMYLKTGSWWYVRHILHLHSLSFQWMLPIFWISQNYLNSTPTGKRMLIRSPFLSARLCG